MTHIVAVVAQSVIGAVRIKEIDCIWLADAQQSLFNIGFFSLTLFKVSGAAVLRGLSVISEYHRAIFSPAWSQACTEPGAEEQRESYDEKRNWRCKTVPCQKLCVLPAHPPLAPLALTTLGSLLWVPVVERRAPLRPVRQSNNTLQKKEIPFKNFKSKH